MTTWVLKVGGATITATNVDVSSLRLDARATQTLEFLETGKHYSNSWDEGDDVELEWPAGSLRFKGKISEVQYRGQAGQERTEYLAIGARGLAQNVSVGRAGADEGGGEDGFPERVYNAPADDPDAVYNKNPTATPWTLGQILTDLFDSFLTALRAEGAAPAAASPYVAGELALLTHVPPKLVFRDLNFDQVVAQLAIQNGPTWRCYAGTDLVWHFFDSTAPGTTHTVTIGTDLVRLNDLRRHTRDRATAVRIFGDRTRGGEVRPDVVGFGTDENGTSLSGLTKSWTGGLEASWTRHLGAGVQDRFMSTSIDEPGKKVNAVGKAWTVGAFAAGYAVFPAHSHFEKFTVTSNTSNQLTLASIPAGLPNVTPVLVFSVTGTYADVFRLFQITDSAKRTIVQETVGEMDCCPHVVGIIRNVAGVRLSSQIVGIRLEGDGKFRTEFPMVHDNGDGTFRLWDSLKLVYCYRNSATADITVRHPTAGYSGEAAGAPWNIQRETRITLSEFSNLSDASLYSTLAAEIHKHVSAVGLTCNLDIAAIDWTYADPIAIVHVAHATDVTGWEALGAELTQITFDFDEAEPKTRLHLSKGGDTAGLDYQRILDGLKAARDRQKAEADQRQVGGFIDCRSREIARHGSTGVGSSLDAVESADHDMKFDVTGRVQPNYRVPRQGAQQAEALCACDAITEPCNNTRGQAAARQQFLCEPDGQRGLIVKHPGIATSRFCADSQLGGHPSRSPGEYAGPSGIYFPFACVGIDLGTDPNLKIDDVFVGACVTYRRMRVIEPAGIQNQTGPLGTEISTAQAILLMIQAYDNYMQHNEEAHCCLDNRIYCADVGVWGGNFEGCPARTQTGPSIVGLIKHNFTCINALTFCVNQIEYESGPNTPNCLPCPTPEDPHRGPC